MINWTPQQIADAIQIKATGPTVTFQPPTNILAAANWQPTAYGIKNNELIVANNYYDSNKNLYIAAFYVFDFAGNFLRTQSIPLNEARNLIDIAPVLGQSGNSCFFLCVDVINHVALLYDGTTSITLQTDSDIYSQHYGNQWIDGQLNINTSAINQIPYLTTTGVIGNVELPATGNHYTYLGNNFFAEQIGYKEYGAIYNTLTGITTNLPSSYDITQSAVYGDDLLLFGVDLYLLTSHGEITTLNSGLPVVSGLADTNLILSIMFTNNGYLIGAYIADGKIYFGQPVEVALANPGSYSYYQSGSGLFSLLYGISGSEGQPMQLWPVEITYPPVGFSLINGLRNYTHNFSRGVPTNYGGNLILPSTYNARLKP